MVYSFSNACSLSFTTAGPRIPAGAFEKDVRPGIKYTTARPNAIQFPVHGCIDDLSTKRTFDLQATWVSDVLGVLFDIVSTGVCTTRH